MEGLARFAIISENMEEHHLIREVGMKSSGDDFGGITWRILRTSLEETLGCRRQRLPTDRESMHLSRISSPPTGQPAREIDLPIIGRTDVAATIFLMRDNTDLFMPGCTGSMVNSPQIHRFMPWQLYIYIYIICKQKQGIRVKKQGEKTLSLLFKTVISSKE